MSDHEDDGINVTIRTCATVVPSYNAVVKLTDEQARAVDVELMVVAVGLVIRELRQAAGVSLSEFARRAGVGKGRISQIERAKGHKGLTMATLVLVSRALGLPAAGIVAMAEARAKTNEVTA